MQIPESFSSIPLIQTAKTPAPQKTEDLPVQADHYKGSTEKHEWVKGSELPVYKKVYGAVGAACGAFASHIAMVGGFAAAGAAIGGIAGAMLGGPVVAVIGKVGGGALGAIVGAKIQGKTQIGRKIMGRIGARMGEMLGLCAKALKIPLRSDHIKETKNYEYKTMTTHLGDTGYTSHPHLSPKEQEEFISRLKPGDIVLCNDEACTVFSLLVMAADGKADFNHALLYTGDGKTLESRTITHGVAEGDLRDVLSHKHHAIAVRPRYDPPEEQAQAVIEAGREKIGTKYDYLFGMGDESMYCSEFVYKAVTEGAPQVDFKKRPLITKTVVLPGDLLRTSKADVVAEAGKDNTLFTSYMAKFI